MLTLLRRLAARPSSRAQREDRQIRVTHGPLVSMLECDVNNLDRLTRAIAHPRR